MVSVCLLTYNGVAFVEQQVRSILNQLSEQDELIVSDDGSTDGTLAVIEALADQRVRIVRHTQVTNQHKNRVFRTVRAVSSNCAFALSHARGEVVFLSDQDDVWHSDKVSVMLEVLQSADLAIHNCAVVDDSGRVVAPDYFALTPPRLSVLGLLRKSSFMGCCMAFNRKVLDRALPFPEFLVEHDAWIGIRALRFGKVVAVDRILLDYRRHGDNVSPCGEKSPNSLWVKLMRRVYLLRAYIYSL